MFVIRHLTAIVENKRIHLERARAGEVSEYSALRSPHTSSRPHRDES